MARFGRSFPTPHRLASIALLATSSVAVQSIPSVVEAIPGQATVSVSANVNVQAPQTVVEAIQPSFTTVDVSKFSNPNSYGAHNFFGGVASSIGGPTISNPPAVGQLLVAFVNLTAGPTSPGTSFTDNTGATWTKVGTDQQIAVGGSSWESAFYKIATGAETSTTLFFGSVTGPTASIEVDEFDGFTGIPTLDIHGQGNSGGLAFLNTQSGGTSNFAPELTVSGLAANTAALITSTGEVYASVGGQTYDLIITNGTVQLHVIVGWTAPEVSGATSWTWQYNQPGTPLATGLVGLSFYDLINNTSKAPVVEVVPGKASVAVGAPVAVQAKYAAVEALPGKPSTLTLPAFTNRQSVTSHVASVSSASVSLAELPISGQLLYFSARVAVGTNTDPNIQTPTDNTGLPWTEVYGEQRVGSGSTYDVWVNTWWKVSNGAETYVSTSWTGSATGPWGAQIEVDEFNGFVGTPTIDFDTTIALGGGPSPNYALGYGSPQEFPELAVYTLATSDNMGAISQAEYIYANTYNLNLTQSNPFWLAVGWTGEYDTPGTASDNQWLVNWTTSRGWGIIVTSFYSEPNVQGVGAPVEVIPGKATVGTSAGLTNVGHPVEVIPGQASIGAGVHAQGAGVPVEVIAGQAKVGNSAGTTSVGHLVEIVPGQVSVGNSAGTTNVGHAVEIVPGQASVAIPAGLTGRASVVEIVPGSPTVGHSGGGTNIGHVVEVIPGQASFGEAVAITNIGHPVEVVPGSASIGIGVSITGKAAIVEILPGNASLTVPAGLTNKGAVVEVVPGKPSVGESAGATAIGIPVEVVPGKASTGNSGGATNVGHLVEVVPGQASVGGSAGATTKAPVVEVVGGIPSIGIGVSVTNLGHVVEVVPGKPSLAVPAGLTSIHGVVEIIPGQASVGIGVHTQGVGSVTEIVPGQAKIGNSAGATNVGHPVEIVPGQASVGNSGGVTGKASLVEVVPGTAVVGIGVHTQALGIPVEVIPGKPTVTVPDAITGRAAVVEVVPGKPSVATTTGVVNVGHVVEVVPGRASVAIAGAVSVTAPRHIVEVIPGAATVTTKVIGSWGCVSVDAIPDASVTTGFETDASVTTGVFSPAVTTTTIVLSSVTTTAFNLGAVTTDAFNDGSVTTTAESC